VDPDAGSALLLVAVSAAVGLGVLGLVGRRPAPRRLGLFVLGGAYALAHLVDLGVDVFAGAVYVTLAILEAETWVLADRFAPLYERSLDPAIRSAIGSALARAVQRMSIASAFAILAPVLAGNLAASGTVRASSIPSAVLLAAGFAAVVLLLALLPVFSRENEARATRDQKPN